MVKGVCETDSSLIAAKFSFSSNLEYRLPNNRVVIMYSAFTDKTGLLPRKSKTLRKENEGNRRPAPPAGLLYGVHYDLPMRKARKALQRERRLIARLFEEQEVFKQAVSNEIYEGINQQLVGALLHFQGFERIEKENPVEAREAFLTGVELLRESIDMARQMANRLRPPVLDDFGVVAGVGFLVLEARRSGGQKIEFLSSGELENASSTLKNVVFRIVQELLGNARLHSGSENIRLEIDCNEGIFRIKIEDWGMGFDPAKVPDDRFGLRKLLARASLVGGRVSIVSAPQEGTRIVVELPVAKGEE